METALLCFYFCIFLFSCQNEHDMICSGYFLDKLICSETNLNDCVSPGQLEFEVPACHFVVPFCEGSDHRGVAGK